MTRYSRDVARRLPRPLQGGYRVLSRGGSRRGGLADEYQDALDKANAANEARYQQILSGYDDLHGRVMGDLAGVGDVERRDIARQYRNLGSDTYNRLVNRGFGNSTIPATMQMGVEREHADARSRLASRLAQQRANYDMGITQGKLGVMERRTDEQPDINQMIALSQGLGQAGYGTGLRAIGPPIGLSRGLLQNAYMSGLGRHLSMMPRPYRQMPSRQSQKNQAVRLRRLMDNMNKKKKQPYRLPPKFKQGMKLNDANDLNTQRFQGYA